MSTFKARLFSVLLVLSAVVSGRPAAAQPYTVVHGIATDFFVPADLDRDSRSDPQVWSTGAPGVARFAALPSSGTAVRIVLGQSGDDPTVPGDYDGDGRDDAALYRGGPTSGDPSHWIIRPSGGGADLDVVWGQNGDFPAPGDYDGDGINDFAVQRNHAGAPCAPTGPPQNITPNADFFIKFADGGPNQTVTCFSMSTAVIVPGDYDNDGVTDLAVIRGVAGEIAWTIRRSSDLVVDYFTHGMSATDFPTQADYDGDGRTDAAIWRPSAVPGDSKYFVRRSSNGSTYEVFFGQNGDYPVANFDTH